MATPHIMKVRKVAGATPTPFTVQKPSSVEDEQWKKMLAVPEIDINELAFQMWVIKAADGYRRNGTDPRSYVYGAKSRSGSPALVIDCSEFYWPEDESLAKEQYNFLVRKGAVFTNIDDLPFEIDD